MSMDLMPVHRTAGATCCRSFPVGRENYCIRFSRTCTIVLFASAEGFEPPTTRFGDERSGQAELRTIGSARRPPAPSLCLGSPGALLAQIHVAEGPGLELPRSAVMDRCCEHETTVYRFRRSVHSPGQKTFGQPLERSRLASLANARRFSARAHAACSRQ